MIITKTVHIDIISLLNSNNSSSNPIIEIICRHIRPLTIIFIIVMDTRHSSSSSHSNRQRERERTARAAMHSSRRQDSVSRKTRSSKSHNSNHKAPKHHLLHIRRLTSQTIKISIRIKLRHFRTDRQDSSRFSQVRALVHKTVSFFFERTIHFLSVGVFSNHKSFKNSFFIFPLLPCSSISFACEPLGAWKCSFFAAAAESGQKRIEKLFFTPL